MKLYSYWRSSAAYRLRIALELKAQTFETVPVNLAPTAQEQVSDRFKAINHQMRVPVLEVAGERMIQSMAILEWLEETYPDPSLLPGDAANRQRIRAFADVIACDIHPLNNVSVLGVLRKDFAGDGAAVSGWYAEWIHRGFEALEAAARPHASNHFLFGDAPTLAEICLVPQVYNARRFNVDLTNYPRLVEVDEACLKLEAFRNAAPENQPDAS